MTEPECIVPSDACITLREITAEDVNAILALSVKEDQSKLVASNAKSIAQAHFSAEAWFRAIYADETPVGFVMLYDPYLGRPTPKSPFYEVWRFMIDGRYQGRGFGCRAMELVITHVRTRPNADSLFLGHRREHGHAGGFYRKLGFEYTGNEADGEAEMRLIL
jgi:diamine N-acetyltransferase